jgi:oxygen-dependent protoporphyrinogen oxidase
VTRLRTALGAVPGLAVTGSWVAGTGLAAVVADARAAAASLPLDDA